MFMRVLTGLTGPDPQGWGCPGSPSPMHSRILQKGRWPTGT